jgi:hypothetical protein
MKYDLQIASYNSKGEGELSNVYPVTTDVAGLCNQVIDFVFCILSLIILWDGECPCMSDVSCDSCSCMRVIWLFLGSQAT